MSRLIPIPQADTDRALHLLGLADTDLTGDDRQFLAGLASRIVGGLDDAQFRALFTATGRADDIPYAGIDQLPLTHDIVCRYPDYYITGPGRAAAHATLCQHDYRLTDTCPCCP